MSFIGTLFLVPLFLQEGRGASPLSSGLTTFPEAIGVLAATQLVAKVYPRIGPRRLMIFGMVWVSCAITGLSFIGTDTSDWVVRLVMFLLGNGMACIFLPNQAASLVTVPRELTGRATMFMSVQRQVGAALGVALLSSVLAAVGTTQADSAGAESPHLLAYRSAFLLAAGIALIGAVMATMVPDADAEASMKVRRRERQPAAGRAVSR
jgi:MFS family permease